MLAGQRGVLLGQLGVHLRVARAAEEAGETGVCGLSRFEQRSRLPEGNCLPRTLHEVHHGDYEAAVEAAVQRGLWSWEVVLEEGGLERLRREAKAQGSTKDRSEDGILLRDVIAEPLPFTREHYTAFEAVMPSEHASVAVEILEDMLLHSIIPEKELEKERNVIIEEIKKAGWVRSINGKANLGLGRPLFCD